MAVKYYTDGTDFQLRGKGRIAEWVQQAVETEGIMRETAGRPGLRLGPVNFVFCSPERHLDINRRFLGHDWATDVITFDYSEGVSRASGGASGGASEGRGVVSGDIFIDPVTVAQNAEELCAAPAVEMRRVMIHGVLHLCGYGDKTPGQQRKMRAKEDFYLRKFYESV